MSIEREKQWENLVSEVNALGGDGEDFAAAVKELYSLYDEDVMYWYAGLFDAKIGGFYFANSARDAEGYLPDIEATQHCLGFFEKFEGVYDYATVCPDWMKERIGKWIKGLQDPNGYFYHPQWDKAFTDTKLARKGRDLNYGLGTMSKCGFQPTYDTPLGQKGDGLLPDGTPVDKPVAVAESATEVKEAPKKESTLKFSPHLETVEAFRAYLDGLYPDLCTRPYWTGNQFSNQIGQIKARDKMLREAGETVSICDMLIDWFNGRQNPETGNWYHPEEGDAENAPRRFSYEGNNSLLKIIDVYNQFGAELHYPVEAARSAMKAITAETPPSSVCDVYNTWFAVWQVINNIKDHSTLPDEKKAEYIALIRRELLKDAPTAIRASKNKISLFKRPDHGFSYTPKGTSITSQGMPVALPGFDESDTNASGISIGFIKFMFMAFELKMIKPFPADALPKYLELLEAKRTQ